MRKLLLILFTLSCFFASAQKIQYVNTYGYQYQRLVADTLLGLPKDTFTVPTALRTIPFLANKSGTIYKWNISTFAWDAFTGGGSKETASEGLIHRQILRTMKKAAPRCGFFFGLVGGSITSSTRRRTGQARPRRRSASTRRRLRMQSDGQA